MAYSTSNPPALVSQAIAGGPSLWFYSSADAIADVDAAGYFSNGGDLGMKVGDSLIIVDTTNSLSSMGQVSTLSSGAATVVGLTAFP